MGSGEDLLIVTGAVLWRREGEEMGEGEGELIYWRYWRPGQRGSPVTAPFMFSYQEIASI